MFPAAAWLLLLVAPGPPWATGDPIQETADGDLSKLGACFRGSAVEVGGLNLGQRWGDPSPTATLFIDLRTVTSAASSFDFRTFDPEGVIFYGDTSPGDDWFVLALRRGKPIMQIHNSLTNITVSGGRHLNDGQWHRILLSQLAVRSRRSRDKMISNVDLTKDIEVGDWLAFEMNAERAPS